MFKMIGWLGKTVVSAVLVSILTVYVAWTTVQVYADKLMKQFSLENQTGKADFSEVLSKLSQNLNILKQPLEKSSVVQNSKPTASSAYGETGGNAGTGNGIGNGAGTGAGTGTGSGSGSGSASSEAGANAGGGTPAVRTPEERVPDNALPVMSQTSSTGSKKSSVDQNKQTVLSAADFTRKKDEMSTEDKMQVFTILANRLPQSELQKISGYVEDGLTEDEMTDVQTIVGKYVKPEEMDQLLNILQKY